MDDVEKIQLEQEYLYQLLRPLLELQGIYEQDAKGITKEFIDKEVLADTIVAIINKHGAMRVKDLRAQIKKQEERGVEKNETGD